MFAACNKDVPGEMAGTTGRHDVGGSIENAPIDVDSGTKEYKLWEMQTHCLVTLISKKGLLTVDEVYCPGALQVRTSSISLLHVLM